MTLLFYALIFSLIAFATWYYTKYSRRNSALNKFPTIKSYPLIGSNLSFLGKTAVEIFKTFQRASVELGPNYRIDLSPFESNIITSDPKVIEGILSSQKLIVKSKEYDFVRRWLNEGCETIKETASLF